MVNKFRDAFPQFDAAVYPDTRLAYWLEMAEISLPVSRWGKLHSHGCYLYAAHHLALEKAMEKSPEAALNLAGGAVVSESRQAGALGKSVSRSATGVGMKDQGQWGLTVYGQQYIKLCRIVGAQAVQI